MNSWLHTVLFFFMALPDGFGGHDHGSVQVRRVISGPDNTWNGYINFFFFFHTCSYSRRLYGMDFLVWVARVDIL